MSQPALFAETPFPETDLAQMRYLSDRFGIHEPADLNQAVIFGTAHMGRELLANLNRLGVRIAAFADNDESCWGMEIQGVPVIAPTRIPEAAKVVVASMYVKDIEQGLRQAGTTSLNVIPHYVLTILFPEVLPRMFHAVAASQATADKGLIAQVFERLADAKSREVFADLLKFRLLLDSQYLPEPEPNQYFPDFLSLSENELFVDVGACDGDTLKVFLARSQGRFRAYHAFEPDKQNMELLLACVPEEKRQQVYPHQVALGSASGEASFSSGMGNQSKVCDSGTERIQLTTLDECFGTEQVTFIKIDVEGYEGEVIAGAARLIKEQAPKLAVSVYHKPDDLWRLMALILSIQDGYRFYMRHHAPEIYETVLYCLPG